MKLSEDNKRNETKKYFVYYILPYQKIIETKLGSGWAEEILLSQVNNYNHQDVFEENKTTHPRKSCHSLSLQYISLHGYIYMFCSANLPASQPATFPKIVCSGSLYHL